MEAWRAHGFVDAQRDGQIVNVNVAKELIHLHVVGRLQLLLQLLLGASRRGPRLGTSKASSTPKLRCMIRLLFYRSRNLPCRAADASTSESDDDILILPAKNARFSFCKGNHVS